VQPTSNASTEPKAFSAAANRALEHARRSGLATVAAADRAIAEELG